MNVLANDIAGDNGLAASPYRILTQPAYGTLNANPYTGVIQYFPISASFTGSDSFTYQLEDGTASVGDIVSMVNEASPVRAFFPTDPTLGATWQSPEFDDSTWRAGTGYVGYDTNGATGGDFNPLVGPASGGIDVAAMRGMNSSVYALWVHARRSDAGRDRHVRNARAYDDGFVAYLNGVRIASRSVSRSSVVQLERNIQPQQRCSPYSNVDFRLACGGSEKCACGRAKMCWPCKL